MEDRISGLKDKIDIMEKYLDKKTHELKKKICKNSVTPSKNQTYKS
jgi:hypothetical protein